MHTKSRSPLPGVRVLPPLPVYTIKTQPASPRSPLSPSLPRVTSRFTAMVSPLGALRSKSHMAVEKGGLGRDNSEGKQSNSRLLAIRIDSFLDTIPDDLQTSRRIIHDLNKGRASAAELLASLRSTLLAKHRTPAHSRKTIDDAEPTLSKAKIRLMIENMRVKIKKAKKDLE